MTHVAALVALLREFYSDEEAFRWLISPQPLFDDEIALDMIADGRASELVKALRRMAEGVYL